MKFRPTTADSWYLDDTRIENIFINDYMGSASGDCVKVYLLAQMYSRAGDEVPPAIFAGQLGMSENAVRAAWDYWQSTGIVKINEYIDGTYDVELCSLREQYYAQPAAPVAAPEVESARGLTDDELASLYTSIERLLGRPLGGMELPTISSWMDEGASAEAIAYAYNYCVTQHGKDNVRYVGTVLKGWTDKGLLTPEQIEAHIATSDVRRAEYRRIFKSLGFMRNPTEAEAEIMNTWFDQYAVTIDEILFACSKTSSANNPNIKYVDGIIRKMVESGQIGKAPKPANHPVSIAKLNEYYDFIRERAGKEARKRRAEVYEKIPEMETLENEIRVNLMNLSKAKILKATYEIEAYQSQKNKLHAQKKSLMEKAGLPLDFMEEKYLCEKCKDTGYLENGERCSCYETRMSEAEEWQKSLRR